MLPALREELSLYGGPATATGAPTWSLHDPVRNAYFRIDWLTFEILSRWHLQEPAAIAEAVSLQTPIQDVEPEDVDLVLRFLAERELLQRADAQFSRGLASQVMRRRTGIWHWLLHRYLFFRVPLWKPDAWLSRHQQHVEWFYSRGFFGLTALVLLVGLMQLNRQWDVFAASFVDLFSWQGLAAYAVTLVLVKFAHELGHAFTAKRMGCRVPNMGVAFLVMFPMAYTDVNDAWKLPRRRQRLAVGAAGILTELLIAAWATLAWAVLPDGALRSGMFLLASTTWVSTLLINASPFMRFDGYFLLMDWLDMPNLHARAFALGRWRLREWLFGANVPPPEQLPARRQRWLIVFAYGTWIYRFLVFGGIALLVYSVFPKPLGPILGAVELGWFIVVPILHELKAWRPLLPGLLSSARGWRTLGLLLMFLVAIFLPWDTRIAGQAVLKPVQSYPLVAPGGARISALPVVDGTKVSAQTVLVRLEQLDLRYQQQALSARSGSLAWQAVATGVDPRLRDQQQVIEAQRAKVEAELQGVERQRLQYLMKAPFAGVVYFNNPDMVAGDWVGKNEKLGELIGPGGWRVETYLSEADIQRLAIGDKGMFYAESGNPGSLEVMVESIDPDATHELSEAMLASTRGGALPVREHAKALVPEHAVYRVVLKVGSQALAENLPILRGQVVIHGAARPWLAGYFRAALAVLRREAGF